MRVTKIAPSTKRSISRGLSIRQTRPVVTASPMLQSGHQRAAFRFDPIGFQRARLPARLHRFRPRLHNKQFVALAVLRPFHIHGAAIVMFDHAGPACERQNFIVAEHEAAALGFGCRHVARRPLAGAGIDHFLRLGADRLFDDRDQRRIGQERLEDLIFVGIDGALHDVFAEAPGRVDDHNLVESSLSVDREHHAGAAEVRAHHVLDADRKRDFQMIEALGFAVSDGAVGKQRRIAAPASIEQSRHAANIEERFLLAGEACVRQILRRRARAHRDIRIDLARPAAELLVRLGDGRGEFIGPCAAQKGVPNSTSLLPQA